MQCCGPASKGLLGGPHVVHARYQNSGRAVPCVDMSEHTGMVFGTMGEVIEEGGAPPHGARCRILCGRKSGCSRFAGGALGAPSRITGRPYSHLYFVWAIPMSLLVAAHDRSRACTLPHHIIRHRFIRHYSLHNTAAVGNGFPSDTTCTRAPDFQLPGGAHHSFVPPHVVRVAGRV